MGLTSLTLNFPAVLLQIGYLTTPTSVRGVSLSEFWAWVRYLAAITDDPDLRLTSAFADLDAHQKTILSDDFGMGVPMHWLATTLDFQEICDGRYFLDRFGATARVAVTRTAKRGPNKTPDFVARDGRGVWHIVECKGTQSGTAYQSTQIGDLGPPPTGGIAQKQAIIFPRGHTGQRLVAALSIGLEGVPGRSSLRVVDPEPELEDPVEVSSQQLGFAVDAAQRSTLAKTLRLSGFDATAEVTAAPIGAYAWSRPDTRRRVDEMRRRTVEEKSDAAREELARTKDRRTWTDAGRRYRGRELTFDLPQPIMVGGKPAYTAIVRQGVSEAVLRELRARPQVEEPLPETNIEWREAIGRSEVETDRGFARLRIGELFTSELRLRS